MIPPESTSGLEELWYRLAEPLDRHIAALEKQLSEKANKASNQTFLDHTGGPEQLIIDKLAEGKYYKDLAKCFRKQLEPTY